MARIAWILSSTCIQFKNLKYIKIGLFFQYIYKMKNSEGNRTFTHKKYKHFTHMHANTQLNETDQHSSSTQNNGNASYRPKDPTIHLSSKFTWTHLWCMNLSSQIYTYLSARNVYTMYTHLCFQNEKTSEITRFYYGSFRV